MELTREALELRRETARDKGVVIIASGTMQHTDAGLRWVIRPRRHHVSDPSPRISRIRPSEEALLIPDIKIEKFMEVLRRYANNPVTQYPW